MTNKEIDSVLQRMTELRNAGFACDYEMAEANDPRTQKPLNPPLGALRKELALRCLVSIDVNWGTDYYTAGDLQRFYLRVILDTWRERHYEVVYFLALLFLVLNLEKPYTSMPPEKRKELIRDIVLPRMSIPSPSQPPGNLPASRGRVPFDPVEMQGAYHIAWLKAYRDGGWSMPTNW